MFSQNLLAMVLGPLPMPLHPTSFCKNDVSHVWEGKAGKKQTPPLCRGEVNRRTTLFRLPCRAGLVLRQIPHRALSGASAGLFARLRSAAGLGGHVPSVWAAGFQRFRLSYKPCGEVLFPSLPCLSLAKSIRN